MNVPNLLFYAISSNTESIRQSWGTSPGLILEIKGMRTVQQKSARKSSKRAQLWIFTQNIFKFRAFGILNTAKQQVVLKVFTENEIFYFSKRALRVGS